MTITIQSSSNWRTVGGLVGKIYQCGLTVSGSSMTITINGQTDQIAVGGIAGWLYNANIYLINMILMKMSIANSGGSSNAVFGGAIG